ncbi:oxidoreductase alpha (molybdopterin) subunit [Oryzisolibacter propanilivorax]|uniref:Oxidoreductase alpha (Molybdopterin) subunit n=1 Tax=Oryzisolibacter propanilivorax TaxID=1527607 RepID=A0A1G9RET1_9BURK|nr:FdhF/YdeP family oxidoreductase [Oryzisolibacter propanilivorax]SDM21744.1 oxidoreductase alpha (molybdopterin) subunit [Oryzisolibacter propanilivorax]
MSREEEARITLYDGPAGGWGALNSVKDALLHHQIPLKGAKTLLHANQPDGFDCPGCAWPDRNHHSTFEFCENGAKAVAAEATARRATPEFFARHTVAQLAARSDHWLEEQGRLTHPMRYDAASDRYVPIEWDAAFALVVQHLNALPDPNQAIFYTSGRTSNEAAFLYQLFVRQFGTNNFPDCSNMCHEPSGTAMRGQIGVGKGTVTLQDFERADAIFIFGQNPGTNHPRMLGELRAAHRRGARIVSFNPLRERGLERFADPQDKREMATLGSTPISTHYFQPRVGGDLAAVTAMTKHVLEAHDARGGVLDEAFITQHTLGLDALRQQLADTPWALLKEESGLTEAQLRAAGDVYLGAERVIACWGMGITQHQHAVATIEAILNLLLLRGHIGREGAGPCPVRGHSNVQGDRTMGIWEAPPPALLDRLQQVYGFAPPRAHGVDTVGAIRQMAEGRCQVFFALGGNFAAATPDTHETWHGLRQCGLTVHVTTKLNRSHLVHGREALILPCLGRTEVDRQAGGPQGVTVEDSMSMVHISTGMNPPASAHLLSEPAIVARLAAATLGARSAVPWAWLVEDYARIRDEIEKVFPDFHDFNARVAVPGGFRLRNTASERVWATPSGRARFASHALPLPTAIHAARAREAAQQVFTLLSTRSHDQYNTTIYGLNDRYRGVRGQRDVVFIHPEDLRALGLRAGERVDLHAVWPQEQDAGHERCVRGFTLVAFDIARGSLAAYYPEVNPLVPLWSVAEGAGTPTSKSIPVVLVPHRPDAPAA